MISSSVELNISNGFLTCDISCYGGNLFPHTLYTTISNFLTITGECVANDNVFQHYVSSCNTTQVEIAIFAISPLFISYIRVQSSKCS